MGVNKFMTYDLYKNPSPDHSFDSIGMKLGMDTPWDPGKDLGKIRLRFAARALRYVRNG